MDSPLFYGNRERFPRIFQQGKDIGRGELAIIRSYVYCRLMDVPAGGGALFEEIAAV
jgi:hypothetical protein